MEGAFEQWGLKINLEKTKLLVTGGERWEVVQVRKLYRWGGTHVVGDLIYVPISSFPPTALADI